MKKSLLFSSLILYFNLVGFGQSHNSNLSNVVERLKVFSSNHVIEKAYLQFDKPYYAAGDTIYFKAYVTKGERHQLSDLSGVLHAELISPENKIDQSIKLRLDSGVCWGDFALPDSLPAGNYRIRAYTQWMRNNGESNFFDRNIAVGSVAKVLVSKSIMKQPLQVSNNKADIQFFPEGGSLVTGIRTKVGFKALDTNGLAINVKGVILNKGNKEVCNFVSMHSGMGYFFLSPSEGDAYKARLTFADGTQDIVELPKPEASGINLTVNNDSIAKVSITIRANFDYYQANLNKDFFLLIYSGGTAITATFNLDSYVTTLDLLKRKLHTGVATVTLFSSGGEPLCERLLFVQNNDQLNLHINTNKTEYTKREKVNLALTAKAASNSPVAGHFSLSVIDESKVPADENNETTILTDLLLTSDLTGYVEQPNYYFNDTSENARNNLDALMLTQGYRRFEWKQVLDSNYVPVAYQPEKGLEINGMVTDLSGKPIANGTITLLPSEGGPVLNSVSDNKGLFHFSNLVFTDTTHFVLSAVNSNGRNSTSLTYFTNDSKPPLVGNPKSALKIVNDTAMAAYLENTKNARNEIITYGFGKGVVLKEVTVRAYRTDDQYKTQSLAGAGHADQVMHADEIEKVSGPLSTSLNGRLHGVAFSQGAPYLPGISNGPMIVIVDGAEMGMQGKELFNIDEIPSSQVETVEVLKYSSGTIYGMTGGNGVLIITTKQGGERKTGGREVASKGVLPIAPTGFYKAREFYSPKYDPTNMSSKQRDLRSTIYWNPEIKTDKDGNASLDYYNADGNGTYKVVIEGMDNNGNIGRQVYRYLVK